MSRSIPVRLLAAGSVAAALSLAGCGGGSHRPRVASLPTAGHPSSHHSGPAGASAGIPDPGGRPRASLDMSGAQEASLYDPYFACLRAHRYIDQYSLSSKLAVVAKCKRLDPLPAWPVDPANPQARAFIGRTVTCLLAKGYHASAQLVSNVPFEAADWEVAYTPHDVQYHHATGVAQNACQQKALK